MGFPSGMVTLLFTDIEGGIRLWETDPKAMAEASARHNCIVGEQIEGAGGQVFKTVGEAFRAVFADPSAAMASAVAVQQAAGAEPMAARAARSGCAWRCIRGLAWSGTATISVRW